MAGGTWNWNWSMPSALSCSKAGASMAVSPDRSPAAKARFTSGRLETSRDSDSARIACDATSLSNRAVSLASRLCRLSATIFSVNHRLVEKKPTAASARLPQIANVKPV